MVINSNIQAQQAANNLNTSANALSKSLSRLSSGSKIIAPSDDAAGLAVSSRLESQLKRLDAAINNVVNAVSFTQTQDGFLKTIDKAFRRMSELTMFAQDSTKSASDLTLYSQEFTQLQDYVRQTVTQTFNSVSLFSEDPLAVTIDSSGTTFDMAPINLSKSEYTSSLSVAQLLTTANVQNIARDTTGKIQLTVTEEEYLKMPKGGSLTLSGFTSATPTGGTSTDLTGLNGTFDITDSFKVTDTSATPTHRYIIELDGTAGGTTALGAVTTFTSTTTSGVTTRTVPAIPSTGILT
jgi:flagellin